MADSGAVKDNGDMSVGQRVSILDCPFDLLTLPRTVERCLELCRGPRVSHTIVTVNASTLVTLREDAAFREACIGGDLVVPDGMPVIWAGRLLGTPLPGRVAGVDLMAALISAAARERLRVFFLGARAEVIRDLVAHCRRDHAGLVVAGARDGYFEPAESAAVVAEIREAKADILFIGMPSPFKEVWAQEHKAAFATPVIIGVGGSFDVLAGYVKRAPRWMQETGFEWLWRLMMEPSKMWKRYLVGNSIFLWMLLRGLIRQHLTPGGRHSMTV